MSDDLIKRDDALATIDTFKRNFEQPWKVQFSADIRALPAVDLSERIAQLERERDAALAAQDYTYIGKDMKPILARDLEDAKDEALAKLAKSMESLRNIRELNMTAEDKNGHQWANSDLIEQEIVAALAELEGK